MQPAKLALEDGTVFAGKSFGAPGEVTGEACFNTSMTGYQEVLTDPSYCGQIVAMTYPEIGNYGINVEDAESRDVFLSGFVVRHCSSVASNFRSTCELGEYLKKQGVVAIEGIDTRALVRRLRIQGVMRSALSTVTLDDEQLVELARGSSSLAGRDTVQEVLPPNTTPTPWTEPVSPWCELDCRPWKGDRVQRKTPLGANAPRIVALDFGMKHNIPRELFTLGAEVLVVPGTITAEEVLALNPSGVFLSNGPGDPAPLTYAHQTIATLLGKVPIFGICLGHQLLALACGAETYKLKFGHRGSNQPVLNHATNRVEITAQNHGFAVVSETLPAGLTVTHTNLNDGTVEGIEHREAAAFSVQYHPESSPGPHESRYLFQQFLGMLH